MHGLKLNKKKNIIFFIIMVPYIFPSEASQDVQGVRSPTLYHFNSNLFQRVHCSEGKTVGPNILNCWGYISLSQNATYPIFIRSV